MWCYFNIFIAILTAIYWILKVQYKYWEKRNIFSPKPRLIFGNISGKGFFWDIKSLYQNFKQHKPFFGCYMYTKPMLMITDLNLVKNIMIKDFEYFRNRGSYSDPERDPLTGHLLNLENEKWKNLRAKLTPTFTSGKMKYMFNNVTEIGTRLNVTLSETIANNQDKPVEIEIKELMSRYTIDVIGTIGFGIECNSLKDQNSEFYRIGKHIFNKGRGKLSKMLLRLNFRFLIKLFNIRSLDKEITEFFKNLIGQTIQYREENNIKRKDFMDLLIELKNSPNGLTFNELLAQCFVFFAAGYETSSSTMTFTLYELAQNETVQGKLRDEINTILDKNNGVLSYDALNEMTYLEQVLNESLRLHTPAPATFRVACDDYKVPHTDFVIKKGTRVILPYGFFHLDKDYYPDPRKFDPERFNVENCKNRSPTQFLPFGDGPRNCIGMRFGKLESKIGLVLLLKNYKFKNCSKTQIPIELSWKATAVLQPTNLWLKIEPINKI